MKTKYFTQLSMAFIFLASGTITSYAQNTAQDEKQKPATVQRSTEANYKITFIELGSVRCIPCQKMQPVMKSIEKKYAGQVKVVFHDVWTPEGKPFASIYGIESIPTQVFLDENGKEFSRHVGYFPEKELVKVLKQKGVK
jgi:thioredoxin 1